VGAGIDAAAIVEVVEAATGMGLSADQLEGLARRLVSETLELGPGPGEGATNVEMELRRRFA
jgi:hypothetical protein